MSRAWPMGQQGRFLALGLTLACLAAIWLGAVAPLLAWYDGRREALAQRRAVADHMAELAALLPALRHRLSADPTKMRASDSLLAGADDAVAGAALQESVQGLASRAGAALASAEILPAQPVGRYRRIALHVSIDDARWADLVRLLASIAEARPRMLVGDLDMHASRSDASADAGGSPPIDASLTVFAFRPGQQGGQSP